MMLFRGRIPVSGWKIYTEYWEQLSIGLGAGAEGEIAFKYTEYEMPQGYQSPRIGLGRKPQMAISLGVAHATTPRPPTAR